MPNLVEQMLAVRHSIAEMTASLPNGNDGHLSDSEKEALLGMVEDCRAVVRLVETGDSSNMEMQAVAPSPYGGPVVTASTGQQRAPSPVASAGERHGDPEKYSASSRNGTANSMQSHQESIEDLHRSISDSIIGHPGAYIPGLEESATSYQV